jgi:hypothetical protein
MAKRIYIERLTRAIEQAHHCRAEWIATGPIKQVIEGRTIWEGDVETFALIGHPKARRAFAWAQPKGRQGREDRVVTILEIPPVDSAEKAVNIAVAEEGKKIKCG